MWNRLIIGTLVFMVILSGCAVKKATETTEGVRKEVSRLEKKRILDKLGSNQLIYTTYSGKAKTNLTVNDRSFNATMNLRIKHNEAIWVSVTVFMGIEAARVLITPERIQIINRIEGKFIDKPFDYIYSFTSRELSFEEVESLLVGNTMEFALDPQLDYFKTASGMEIIGSKQDLDFTMGFGDDYKLKSTELAEKEKSQTLLTTYEEFKAVMEQIVPQRVKIGLKAPKLALKADLQYNNISLDEELDIPFSIPSGFKPVN